MYVKQGNQISIIESAEFNKTLAAGNYLVQQNPHTNQFYLTPMDDFTFPEKVYGHQEAYAERYLHTFNDRKGNLGILLGGVKGTGKSLLAKFVCKKSNLPVLVVSQPFGGTAFEQFLSMLRQPCVVFMDEFEKTYHTSEAQQSLLSILDGVFEGEKLFLLTANTMKINEFLTNRPGRIYYSREYTGLTTEVMEEVIDDLLINKENKDLLMRDLMMVGVVNMDMLITIIGEMNRYNETSTASLSFLNIFPERTSYTIKGRISVPLLIDNPALDENGKVDHYNEDNYRIYQTEASGFTTRNPLSQVHNFNQEVSYRDERNHLDDHYLDWDVEEMNFQIENGFITIRHNPTGDYLTYTPSVKATKDKVSSDMFIKKKAVEDKVRRDQETRDAFEELLEKPMTFSEAQSAG